MRDEKCIKRIEGSLCDEQSKMIYDNRLNYSLTKEYRFIENVVDKTVRNQPLWKNFCEQLAEKSAIGELVMFGAGIWGSILYEEIKRFVCWKCVVDSMPQDKSIGGMPAMALEEFVESYTGEWVVISSYKNSKEMKSQLLENRISAEKVINGGEIIYWLTECVIYFNLPRLMPLKEKEIFIDAGGFDGTTTKQFLDWGGGNGYSYCFEPDEQNIAQIKRNLDGYFNYEIVSAALWSKSKRLAMDAKGNFSTFVGEIESKSDGQIIMAVSLDDFMRGREVTFIKMDIEGAEADALYGAKRIIASQKPRLAISIYHKPEDIWVIPKLILDIYPGYDFYLRHYSFAGYDTVLYAIP